MTRGSDPEQIYQAQRATERELLHGQPARLDRGDHPRPALGLLVAGWSGDTLGLPLTETPLGWAQDHA